MILNWASGPYTNIEKLLGTLYDAGVIRRSDLMFLLDWKRSNFDNHLLQLRKEEMLVTSRERQGATVYMLAPNGIRAAHQLCHSEGKIVTMGAQISHQTGVNDILLRLVHENGREGVSWWSTREASDELWNARKKMGNNDIDIRKTYIRPDALIRTPGNGFFWIEFDNATESSRQIRKKFILYVTNLRELKDRRVQRVMWVAPTVARAQWLQARWNEIRLKDNIEMQFYTAGEETCVLAGNKDQQTV